MPGRNLIFSNIVSTPTLKSWAQAYNAGKLFAVLSLMGEVSPDASDNESLGAIGKKILNSLEQEFFTLETKDLKSIKSAVEATVEKVPDHIESSFAVAAIINNIAYLFVLNKGKVSLKREDKIGAIIDSNRDSEKLKASSGFLKDKDIIILQTDQFTNLISDEKLSSSLDHQPPSEISETLAPFVHEAEEGGAAAVIIQYHEEKGSEENEQEEEKEVEKEKEEEEKFEEVSNIRDVQEEEEEKIDEPKNSFFFSIKDRVKFPRLRVNHSKKIYLTIAIVILLVLASSIYLAYKNQQDNKIKATFAQYYPDAEKKYQEGQALVDLNESLARDSFTAAEKILNEAKDKLPDNSEQEKTVLQLLSQVQSALKETSGVSTGNTKEVSSSESNLLAYEKNKSGNYFFESEKNIYSIDSKGITLDDDISPKTIVENEDDWEEVGGFGVYFGNIYVLDKENGIYKFTSGSYAKSDYFTGEAPDLSDAKALAIDGSIWILFSNGDIKKFTRGKEDSFKVSGLDKKMANPSKIYTNIDSDYVYILDNGNSRIVVLNKDGSYKEQYQAGVIKGAKDFDIKETDKKIFVLSSGKIYQIDLK